MYQDIPTNVLSGDKFCASAELAGAYAGSSSGSLAIWLVGGAAAEASSKPVTLSGLDWKLAQTCVTATGAHTVVRVQFYPTVNGPTVLLDAVSVL